MSFRTFMTIHTIAVAYFGLGGLLAPELVWGSIYGMSLDAGAIWALRATGFLASGNAILSWLLRDTTDVQTRNAFTTALLFEWGVYLVLAVQGQLAGLFNTLNWSNAAIAAVWTLAFAYFRFMRQPEAALA